MLQIKKVDGYKFKWKYGYMVSKGWAFYVEGKGFVTLDKDPRTGLDSPYTPKGGRKALLDLIDVWDENDLKYVMPMSENI